MNPIGRAAGIVSLLLLVAVPALAAEIPLRNWTVPAYQHAFSAGLSTMNDLSPGVGFVAMAPCRLVDTRDAGFPPGFGPPSLAAGSPRNFDLNSQPSCSGIPAGVDAYSLNVTVTNTSGPGFLVIFPQGGSQPSVSSLNYVAGDTLANAVIVPAGSGGGITIIAGVSGADVIIDINGYFTDSYNPGVPFRVVGDVPPAPPGSGAIIGINTSTTTNAYAAGGLFVADSCGYGAAGVNAFNASAGLENKDCGPVLGVWGSVNSLFEGSAGVLGTAFSPEGLVFGVAGATNSSTNDSAGVFGFADGLSPGRTYGVMGESDSNVKGAAGVVGVDRSGLTAAPDGPGGTIGVRGDSRFGTGVLGVSEDHIGITRAVSGHLVDFETGDSLTAGHLGYDAGKNNYAVFADGDYGGTGAKYFVEPHPSDASKVIRYVALEGPEAGTYFRGKGRFQDGMATIEVPEDFRLVTDPDSLSVVATPLGDMAVIAVSRVGLDRIVLRSSRNVEFFYLVNGERKSHRHLQPIAEGNEYLPRSANSKMPPSLTEEQKRVLVSNGTYNPDGTVNLETAQRLGWAKVWQEREAATREARKSPRVRLLERN